MEESPREARFELITIILYAFLSVCQTQVLEGLLLVYGCKSLNIVEPFGYD